MRKIYADASELYTSELQSSVFCGAYCVIAIRKYMINNSPVKTFLLTRKVHKFKPDAKGNI